MKSFRLPLYLATLLPSLAFVLSPVTLGFEKTRIVGGTEAQKLEFPFLISLQKNSRHICGGSLIKESWVLTAAHCLKGQPLSAMSVKVGLHKQSDTKNVETFRAKRIIIHPEYDVKIDSDFDYALIELNGKSKFKPVTLNRQEIEIPEDEASSPIVTTAGWGTLKEGGGVSSVLMKVNVPLVSDKRCEAAYPRAISDRMICAGFDKGGKDSCQGDSGGPLFANSKRGNPFLIGVVSWGMGCARPKKYGVYSKVNVAVDWIEANAKIRR